MHPSILFKEADFAFQTEIGDIYDEDIKKKFMDLQAMNFIGTKLRFPLYKIVTEYVNAHDNYKEGSLYMIMNTPIDRNGEQFLFAEMEADRYLEKYNEQLKIPYRELHVKSVEHFCDLVLPIG